MARAIGTQNENATQENQGSESGSNALIQELLQEVRGLREESNELRSRLKELESQPAGNSVLPTSEGPTAYERNLAKLNRKVAQQRHAADEAAAALEEGRFKFSVSIEKEPMMTRVVGATSDNQHEAIRKYNTYFGIRSSSKEIRAVPVEK